MIANGIGAPEVTRSFLSEMGEPKAKAHVEAMNCE